MKFEAIKYIKKFTALTDLEGQFNKLKFKLGDRWSYYMGDGYVFSYSEQMFKVENYERIEYGETGEFLTSVSFFINTNELKEFYGIESDEGYDFESNTLGTPFEVVRGISLGDTYESITKKLRAVNQGLNYDEGETRALKNGVFMTIYNYVVFGNFTFLFFGESKTTPLSAFTFDLVE